MTLSILRFYNSINIIVYFDLTTQISETALVKMELDDIIDELENADKREFSELKSFQSAPKKVMITFEALCILLDVNNTWRDAKMALLGNSKEFIEKLKNFDKDNILGKKMDKIRRMIAGGNLNPDELVPISRLTETLCRWVIAVEEYDRNKSKQ